MIFKTYFDRIRLMKTDIKNLPKSKVKITVELDAKEMKKYFDEAYVELAPTVSIKGFRAGRAPRNLVIDTIGEMKLNHKALDKALQDTFIKALEENKVISVGSPAISVKEQKDGLVYDAEVDVWPEVELGDYTKLSVKSPKAEETTEKEVDDVVSYLRRQKAKISDVEREARVGDRVEINFAGYVNKVVKEKLTSNNHPIMLGDNTMIPGFEEQLIGMKKGEEKTFDLVFPKESKDNEFAGVKIEFKVKMLAAQSVELPEVDEAFIKGFGLKDEKQMRENIKKSISTEKSAKHKQKIEQMVIDKLLTITKTEVPEGLVEQELDRVFHNLEHEAKNMGMTTEQYVLKTNKTTVDLRGEWRKQAEKNVVVGVVLGEVAKREKIDKNEEDLAKKTIEKLLEYIVK